MKARRAAAARGLSPLVACLLLASSVSAAGGQTPPVFPSGVELITVDVAVTDAAGQPVAGLTRDDFVLKEDGAVQPVVSFEAFKLEPPAAAEAVPPPAAASNERRTGDAGRAFALVVDDLGMRSSEAVSARRAVASFLERSISDGDEVTISSASGEVWWTARIPEGREDLTAVVGRLRGHNATLSRSLDDMSDYEAYWIAEHGTSGVSPDALTAAAAQGREIGVGGILERVLARWVEAGLCPQSPRGVSPSCVASVQNRAAELEAVRTTRTRALLDVVRRSLQALAPTRGRKALLLLSPGFLEESTPVSREVTAAAREANTAVYFVDVRGLTATTGMPSVADQGGTVSSARSAGTAAMETLALESAGARGLADDTGGFSVRNTNDLARGLERIAAESRVYYLLGFRAPTGKALDHWRKLRVEVNREGMQVRARRGYTLRRATAEPSSGVESKAGSRTLPAAVERTLDSARDVPGIPLRAMAYVLEPRGKDTLRVVIAAEFDASGLRYEGSGEARSAHLELTVATTRRDTGQTVYGDERVEVRAREGQPAGWRSVARELELPPGVAQTRVVVRDPVSGTLGAVSQRFEVPRADLLRLSTPVLTDQVDRGADGQGRPRAALAAHRVFRPDRPLYCELEVFGAARDPGDGSPHVSAEIAVIAADGKVVRHAPPTRITAGREEQIVRLVGLDLGDLAEGAYELSLAVNDEVAGGRVERHEPFTIRR